MGADAPRKIVLKTMTVARDVESVFDFFEDIKKTMEMGAVSNVAKRNDGWWTFDHVVAGKSKLKHHPLREAGVLDRVFIGGGLEWRVYVRIVPNRSGATVVLCFGHVLQKIIMYRKVVEQLSYFRPFFDLSQTFLDVIPAPASRE